MTGCLARVNHLPDAARQTGARTQRADKYSGVAVSQAFTLPPLTLAAPFSLCAALAERAHQHTHKTKPQRPFTMMKRTLSIALMMLLGTGAALAQEYNRVPAGDQAQYRQCLSHSRNKTVRRRQRSQPHQGPEPRRRPGAPACGTKPPDDFTGNLATFCRDGARASATNKVCEKYSNWSE
jgi:hypothetical protein